MMGTLLDFFTAGTARIQALLYAAIAMLVVVLALVVYGEYWRAQAWKARDQVDQGRTALVAVHDQVQVLAGAVKVCNAGVDEAKAAGARTQALAAAALEQLQAQGESHTAASGRLEALINKKAAAGAAGSNAAAPALDCRDAWKSIAAQRAKPAGAAP